MGQRRSTTFISSFRWFLQGHPLFRNVRWLPETSCCAPSSFPTAKSRAEASARPAGSKNTGHRDALCRHYTNRDGQACRHSGSDYESRSSRRTGIAQKPHRAQCLTPPLSAGVDAGSTRGQTADRRLRHHQGHSRQHRDPAIDCHRQACLVSRCRLRCRSP